MVIPTYVRSRMDQIIDRLIKYSVNTGGHSPLSFRPRNTLTGRTTGLLTRYHCDVYVDIRRVY